MAEAEMGRTLVIGASAACFFAGGLYGWSALIHPMEQAFGATTADAGFGFSLAIVSFTGAVLFTPRLFRGPASSDQLVFLSALGALVVTAAVWASTLISFLILFSIGFGAVSGATYSVGVAISAASTAPRIVTPIVVASFGAGGAAFGPLWRVLDSRGWGLDGLLALSAGLCIVLIFNVVLPGSRYSVETRSGTDKVRTTGEGQRGYLAIIWTVFALGSYSGLMVIGLAAKFLHTASAGVGWVSSTLAILAICNMGGRLSVAWLSGWIGVAGCLGLSAILTLIGLLMILLGLTTVPAVSLGLLLIALGYGLVASSIPVVTRGAFPAASFQRHFAIIFTAWGLAGLSAPWIAGALYELSGSFRPALYAALAAAVGYAIMCRVLIRGVPIEA